jgi:hypothetical protein
MKYKDSRLFDFINYVFKNGNNDPKEYKPPVFLINRWISMTNPLFAKILNLTTNRWCSNGNEFNIKAFYRVILPKYTSKISYIKKNVKEKEIEEDINTASFLQCSQREINLFKDTLEQLNSTCK